MDEIPLELQTKLLRVLQEREFAREKARDYPALKGRGEAAGNTTRCVLIGSHLGARAHGAVGTEPALRAAA